MKTATYFFPRSWLYRRCWMFARARRLVGHFWQFDGLRHKSTFALDV